MAVREDLPTDLTVAAAPRDAARPPDWLVVLAGVLRAVAVAGSAALLLCGLTLLLWASTPEAGSDTVGALRAGIAVLASANAIPVSISGATITLVPLLLTVPLVVALAAVTRRARIRPAGPVQELGVLAAGACGYGLTVAVLVRSLGPAGAVPLDAVLPAAGMGLLGLGIGVLAPDSWCRDALSQRLPAWARAGVRVGLAAGGLLLTAGALALVTSVVLAFGSVTGGYEAAGPGLAAGIGVTLVQLLALPNLVVAATGYLTGVGFEVGSATVSPLGSPGVDALPDLPLPLVAALPESTARSTAGLLWLVVPLVVAVLAARWLLPRVGQRAERVAAVGVAAITAGVLLAALAWFAGGGVTGGPFEHVGAPAALLGGVVVVVLGAVAGTVVALAPAAQPAAPRRRRRAPGAAPVDEVGDEVRDEAEPAAEVDVPDGPDPAAHADAPQGGAGADADGSDAAADVPPAVDVAIDAAVATAGPHGSHRVAAVETVAAVEPAESSQPSELSAPPEPEPEPEPEPQPEPDRG